MFFLFWIAGWWLTYPSEKYESQLGWWFPIYGKIKHIPNHQPDSFGATLSKRSELLHRHHGRKIPAISMGHLRHQVTHAWKPRHRPKGRGWLSMSIWIYVETYSDSISCGLNNAINPPFGNGLYIYIYHLFMVIWGIVYHCFTHIICMYIHIYIYYHVIHR